MIIVDDDFVLLATESATGYKITIIIVFRAIAGKTPAAKSAAKELGRPTMKWAAPKKTEPETNVPIAVKTATLMIELRYCFNAKNKPKNIKAVMGLSMIFGIWPPGKPVVSADNAPVTMDNSITLLISGIRIIPKNIIASIISGLMVRKAGITVCKTTPIPAKSDRTTRFFVFISHLSSANYAICFSCSTLNVYSEKLVIIIAQVYKNNKDIIFR
jgi:hypothetical protein